MNMDQLRVLFCFVLFVLHHSSYNKDVRSSGTPVNINIVFIMLLIFNTHLALGSDFEMF